jgi:hypothetical protein
MQSHRESPSRHDALVDGTAAIVDKGGKPMCSYKINVVSRHFKILALAILPMPSSEMIVEFSTRFQCPTPKVVPRCFSLRFDKVTLYQFTITVRDISKVSA